MALNNGTTNGKLLVSPREAADMLSISERTLSRLTKNGTLPAVRFPGGRAVRYSVDVLRERLAELQSSDTSVDVTP